MRTRRPASRSNADPRLAGHDRGGRGRPADRRVPEGDRHRGRPAARHRREDERLLGSRELRRLHLVLERRPRSRTTSSSSSRRTSAAPGATAAGSDPTFDALYERAARGIIDREERLEVVYEAQRTRLRPSAGVVLAYPGWVQAYRSDRFTGWVPAPGAARLPDARLQLRLAGRGCSPSRSAAAGGSSGVPRVARASSWSSAIAAATALIVGSSRRPPARTRRSVSGGIGAERTGGRAAVPAPQDPPGARHAGCSCSRSTSSCSGCCPATRSACSLGARRLTDADVAEQQRTLGLDQPLPEQYVTYVRQTLTGNLGVSLRTARDGDRDRSGRASAPPSCSSGSARSSRPCSAS